MLAPSMALAGSAPKGATLAAATRRDLVRRLGGGRGAKLSLAAANVFGTPVVKAVQTRNVPLGGMDKRLKGVVAIAHEPVMVGGSGGRAAVVGAMPHGTDTEAEVQSFVTIATGARSHRVRQTEGRRRRLGCLQQRRKAHTTHAIRTVGGKKVLRRIRFRCLCCS